MFLSGSRRSAKAKTRPQLPVTMGPWPLGVNKVLGLAEISPHELAEAVNFKYNQSGGLEIREGLTRYTSEAATNPPVFLSYFPFAVSEGSMAIFADTSDVVWYDTSDVEWVDTVPAATESDELVVTSDNILYYLSNTKGYESIATLSSEATILPFGAYAVILDGGNVKVYSKSAGTVTLAYDDGTGSNGYMADNTDLTSDSQVKLYSGDKVKAGIKFTTPKWDDGYTITATSVKAYLSSLGSPAGNVGCELYDSSGVLQATSTTTVDSATIDSVAELITFTFTSGDMSPETEYWAVVTYSGGDVDNCVQVECDTVASGGTLKYNDGAWATDDTKDPLIGVKPGKPPKGLFGIIHKNRVYIGGDQDNPGYVWYCNVGDVFDWSTADGGGYIGAIDDNAVNFAVGAIVKLFNDIYVFGKANQPYIAKLTGEYPIEYSLPAIFQRSYTGHKTALNIVNDIWFANESGIDALSGVQEYGDLRTFSLSDSVKNVIDSYWDDTRPFSGYNPKTGQYFLKLPGYLRCLVFHTKHAVQAPNGKTRYPVTEYLFVRDDLSSGVWTESASGTNEYYYSLAGDADPSVSDPAGVILDDSIITEGTVGSLSDHQWAYGDNDSLGFSTIYVRDDSGDPDSTGAQVKTLLEPTCFASYRNDFFIGMDDGYIYKTDDSVFKDNSNSVSYVLGLSVTKTPFSEISIDRYHLAAESDDTATVQVQMLSNGVRIDDLSEQLPISGTPDFSVTVSKSSYQQGIVNWNTYRFMTYLRKITPNDAKFRVNGLMLETSVLSK